MSKLDGVRVSSQTIAGFVEVNLMVRAFQRPQRPDARAAAADYCHTFSVLHSVAWYALTTAFSNSTVTLNGLCN